MSQQVPQEEVDTALTIAGIEEASAFPGKS